MARAMQVQKKPTLNAIALLKADHRAVGEMFGSYEETDRKSAKAKLAREICAELSIHMIIEEEIFYPGVRRQVEGNLLDEAHVEHDASKALIAELMAGAPGDSFFDAKMKVLSELIKHHVKEEEQRDGVFAQAKDQGANLDALGARMAARKAELKKAFRLHGMPMPETRSMKGAKTKIGKPLAA